MPTITIPEKLIKEKELMVVPRREYEDLLRIARIIPKDQEWFWTKEWQAKEREADTDIKANQVSRPYRTKGELLAALKRLKK